MLYFTDDCKIFQANLVGQLWGLAPEHPRRYPNLNPHTAGIHRVATGHLPGKQVREFKSGQGKSGKVCSCIWSITASIDLDTKHAEKELFTGKVVHHKKEERMLTVQDASCV